MHASLVVDALNIAAWSRRVTDLAGLICHHDAGSQYTSIAHTDAVADVLSLTSVADPRVARRVVSRSDEHHRSKWGQIRRAHPGCP